MANLTNRVLWAAFVASLVVYVAVAHVVDVTGNPDVVALLLPVFAILSLGTAVASFVLRKRALVVPIRERRLDPETPEGRQRAFVPFVIGLALTESIGIQGLVLSFLSGDPTYSLTFCAGAGALMFLQRPTASDLVSPPSPHRP